MFITTSKTSGDRGTSTIVFKRANVFRDLFNRTLKRIEKFGWGIEIDRIQLLKMKESGHFRRDNKRTVAKMQESLSCSHLFKVWNWFDPISAVTRDSTTGKNVNLLVTTA